MCTINLTTIQLIRSDESNSNVNLMSPQWGDNSKVEELEKEMEFDLFQSPQWGDNSKGSIKNYAPANS